RIAKFVLQNADARQMAEVLRDLFNLSQEGDRFVLVPAGQRPAPEEGEPPADLFGFSGTPLTAVPDERQELSITIDPRTNTLLVSGTEEYLSLVSEIVTELDAIEATERTRRVVRLQNADAKELE